MKNTATAADDSPISLSKDWRDALALFDRELRRRGAAERTRRAYGVDIEQLAEWAGAQGLEPDRIEYRTLRRYAGALSERRNAARTVARKIASMRAFFRVLVEHGHMGANPADLLAGPKKPQNLPAVLKPHEIAALLDRIPATTPLELRDRALFEVAYGCGLRAEELVNLDEHAVEFDSEQLRVEGKGAKTRFVPAGEPALRSLARYLDRARPALLGEGAGAQEPRAVSLEDRAAALDERHPQAPGSLGAARAHPGPRPSPRSATLLRDPPARRRSGLAVDPRAARTRDDLHNPGLHSGRVGAPKG